MDPPTAIISFIVLATLAYVYTNGTEAYPPLPPGPRRLPLLGNTLGIPRSFEWKAYTKWGRELGSDILYLNILGTHIVIANTREVANELLDKRSRIYSSRPYSYMASYFMGYDWLLALMPYGNTWRAARRLLSRHFLRSSSTTEIEDGQQSVEWYEPQVIKYTHVFLRKLLQSPEAFMDHVLNVAGSISLSTIYGLDIAPENDSYITISQKASENLKIALLPGRFWVDTFTLLRFCPSWVGFKRQARRWREDMKTALNVPFNDAKRKREEEGDESMSFISAALNALPAGDDGDLYLLKGTASTLFIGAVGSTSAALNNFFLAMTRHPQLQLRAQTEIDYLITDGYGAKRLPTYTDVASLPYCAALVYEALRWQAVAPIGLPHFSTEEDVYDGYRIPKGSLVIANIWAMLNDPKKYPDPSEFIPERFLHPNGTLNELAVREVDILFGFGRRGCPGKSLALSILMFVAVSLLATFDITKKLDEDGNLIEPRMEFESAITSGVLPFECSIKPRGNHVEVLVMDAVKERQR